MSIQDKNKTKKVSIVVTWKNNLKTKIAKYKKTYKEELTQMAYLKELNQRSNEQIDFDLHDKYPGIDFYRPF